MKQAFTFEYRRKTVKGHYTIDSSNSIGFETTSKKYISYEKFVKDKTEMLEKRGWSVTETHRSHNEDVCLVTIIAEK